MDSLGYRARPSSASRRWLLRASTLLALLSGLLIGTAAHAQEVTATSRSAGLGGALSAGASGTAALWHNPAGIVSAMMYSAEAGYAYDGRTGVNAATANVIDTKSNESFGAALAFTYETANLENAPAHTGYHLRGGFGVPVLDGMVKLGAAIRYSSVAEDDEEILAALILDAGLMFQPLDWLCFGVAGLNLVNGGYDEQLPPTISAGMAVSSLSYGFMVSGDVLFDLSAEQVSDARTWRIGAEYLAGGVFPIRAGYAYDEPLAESRVSVGAGFRDRNSAIGFDASYQHNLDDSADRVFIGSLSAYF
jgi:hypothetical protein